MSIAHVNHAFVAGEISPKFHSRTDLSKYDLGVALAENFFVDYRGGLVSRAGLRWAGQGVSGYFGVGWHGRNIKLKRFRASGNDFLLIFTDDVIRVMRNGAYINDSATSAAPSAITQADPGVVTSTAHPYTTGEWITLDNDVNGMTELNGRIFQVGATTANTFELLDTNGSDIDTSSYTAYTSSGEFRRLVEIATEYSAVDLQDLCLRQWQSELIITHVDYPPRVLTYTSSTSWAIADVDLGSVATEVSGLTLTPSSAATAGVVAGVTAVYADGSESTLPSGKRAINELSVNYTLTAGSLLLEWTPVPEAVAYYVYRSLVLPTGAEATLAQELGYIGQAFGAQFTDNNIIPDFTKTPPIHVDPFANGAAQYITITAAGTSYAKDDTVSISGGGGSGFDGYPVVNAAGEILGVVITKGGSGYSSATVSFTTSTGSGATATVTLNDASGNYPSQNARFQQRQIYAGSTNFPMTVWGSRPGQYTNFDTSSIINAGDAYEFTLSLGDVTPIRHLIPIKSGVLAMSTSGVDQLRAAEGQALTPVNALVDPQAYKGVSTVEPVTIDSNVLFTQTYGSALFEMAYTQYSQSFALTDMSVLSSHLLGEEQEIISLSYAEEPHKLILAGRKDGRWNTMTYSPEQEVYAWTQHWTNGEVLDIETVEEPDRSVTYFAVRRSATGGSQTHIEYLETRKQGHIEDHWGLDASAEVAPRELGFGINLTAGTGTGVTLSLMSGAGTFFTANDLDRMIYVAGGKALVTAYTATTLTLSFIRDVIPTAPNTTSADALSVPSISTSAVTARLYAAVTNVTNLWHLEGQEVTILADGEVITGRTIVNGTLDTPLDTAAYIVRVGLAYSCRVKTLPITSNQIQIEGEKKNLYELALPMYETKGLSTGRDFNNMIPMKVRADTDWDASSGARNDTVVEAINNHWDRDGVVCVEQANPLPATLLGLIPRAETED